MAIYPIPKFHFQVEWGGSSLAFTEVSGFIWSISGQTAAPTPTAPIAYDAVNKKSLLFGFFSSDIF